MDPISASCLNLNSDRITSQIRLQEKIENSYLRILGSVVSISAYEKRNFKNLTPQILAAALVTSFHVVVGISLAYSAILLPQLEKNPEFEVSKSDASLIASILALTTPIGSLIVGFLMDKYGRLTTLKMATIPGIAAWIITALATNVPMLIAGRALIGFAGALGSNPAYVFLTEIARKDMRGSLLSLAPGLASVGMILTFILGWFLSWRQVAWISNIFTAIPFVLLIFIPESPAWLVSKNRIEAAKKSLQWINKYQPKPENKSSVAQLQLALLQKEHERKVKAADSRKSSRSLLAEFKKPTGYKPLIILTGLFLLQHFSGIFIFLFYSISFYEQVGGSINPYLGSVFIGVLRLVVCLANTYVQKKFNNRTLLITSFLTMSLSVSAGAFFTSSIKSGGFSNFTYLPTLCLFLFVITSMIGVVPIPYTMTAEVFPLEIRGVAQSVTLCIASVSMFFSLEAYQYLDKYLGGIVGVLYFFGGVTLVGAGFCCIFVPETHEKKLSEIEEYFKHNFIFLGKKDVAAKAEINDNQETLLEDA